MQIKEYRDKYRVVWGPLILWYHLFTLKEELETLLRKAVRHAVQVGIDISKDRTKGVLSSSWMQSPETANCKRLQLNVFRTDVKKYIPRPVY